MPRKKVTPAELATRLIAVKVMLTDMSDALPTTARELRRNARETLDDVIEELGRAA